jgi:hypothetical protein
MACQGVVNLGLTESRTVERAPAGQASKRWRISHWHEARLGEVVDKAAAFVFREITLVGAGAPRCPSAPCQSLGPVEKSE